MHADETGPAVTIEIAHHVMPTADTPPAADVDPAPPDGVALAWHCHRCGRALGRVMQGTLYVFAEPLPPGVPLSRGRVRSREYNHSRALVFCDCGERRAWRGCKNPTKEG